MVTLRHDSDSSSTERERLGRRFRELWDAETAPEAPPIDRAEQLRRLREWSGRARRRWSELPGETFGVGTGMTREQVQECLRQLEAWRRRQGR